MHALNMLLVKRQNGRHPFKPEEILALCNKANIHEDYMAFTKNVRYLNISVKTANKVGGGGGGNEKSVSHSRTVASMCESG